MSGISGIFWSTSTINIEGSYLRLLFFKHQAEIKTVDNQY